MDIFTAVGGQSTAAAATETALVITAPASRVVEIRRIRVSQITHNTSEQYELTVQRASVAGSGGSAVTPEPHEVSGGAAVSTVSKNPTTEPTYTAGKTVVDANWNSLVGRDIPFPEGLGPKIPPSGILGFFVVSAAGLTTFVPKVEVEFAEIG